MKWWCAGDERYAFIHSITMSVGGDESHAMPDDGCPVSTGIRYGKKQKKDNSDFDYSIQRVGVGGGSGARGSR
jgi:hypothetical protein